MTDNPFCHRRACRQMDAAHPGEGRQLALSAGLGVAHPARLRDFRPTPQLPRGNRPRQHQE